MEDDIDFHPKFQVARKRSTYARAWADPPKKKEEKLEGKFLKSIYLSNLVMRKSIN